MLIEKARKKTYLLIFLGAALAVVLAYVWGRGLFVSPIMHYAHLYGNADLSLRDIDLDVFYAVPKDERPYDFTAIKDSLNSILAADVNFHRTQFRDRSVLHYKLFPSPVALLGDTHSYDTDDTKYGNPQALKSVTLELESRIFDKEGDMYSADFVTPPGHFRVIAIIYEGLGAAGTEGSLLLSRDFISRDEYAPINSSLLYHEFGHSMGMPEGYDIKTNQPYTNDIMGSGRRAPLAGNFIDQATLKAMGVF